VQFVATCLADFAKPVFGRLRPHETLADLWFAGGGNSFPSGHAAFYAGLFLPLMVLFPRYSALFAIPPLFVGVARLMEHDHYLSDVAVSFAFAALLAAGLSFLVERSRAR
jgi:membrane-associated phospholipid phosphatase